MIINKIKLLQHIKQTKLQSNLHIIIKRRISFDLIQIKSNYIYNRG